MKATALRLHGAGDLRLDTFELPEIRDDEILVKVGGETQVGPFTVDMEDQSGRTVMIPVEGNGVQTVDVYLDGVLYDSQEIDFDALAER